MASFPTLLINNEYAYRGHIIQICFCPHTNSAYWMVFCQGKKIETSEFTDLGRDEMLLNEAQHFVDFRLEDDEEL